MEELIATAIRFTIEVVGSALAAIPFGAASARRETEDSQFFVHCFVFAGIGGGVGWLSAAVVPSFIHIASWRIASIFVAPILGGAIGYFLARWQYETRNPEVVPKRHFWYGFAFTVALITVRFAYAKQLAI